MWEALVETFMALSIVAKHLLRKPQHPTYIVFMFIVLKLVSLAVATVELLCLHRHLPLLQQANRLVNRLCCLPGSPLHSPLSNQVASPPRYQHHSLLCSQSLALLGSQPASLAQHPPDSLLVSPNHSHLVSRQGSLLDSPLLNLLHHQLDNLRLHQQVNLLRSRRRILQLNLLVSQRDSLRHIQVLCPQGNQAANQANNQSVNRQVDRLANLPGNQPRILLVSRRRLLPIR